MEEHDIRDSRALIGGCTGADPCTSSREDVQDVLDEMEERQGRRAGAVGRDDVPGEKVVMTLRGEDPEIRKGKRPMGETDQAATRPGKRVRQSKIDEVYTADKQSVFNDKFLQWIYDFGIPFNALRRQLWREVRKAADRLPRGVRMRFPSFKEIGGDGVPEQGAKLAALLREVRESFSHSGATILSDGRKSCDSRPIVNFLAAGATGTLLYATICRDGYVQETGAIVFRKWKAIIESFPAKDVIAFLTDSASNYTATARLLAADPAPVIRDGKFWRYVEFLIFVMKSIHQLLRRMDRGGMMMSIVYDWSRHLVQLLTKLDVVPADLLTPCVREVRMRLMHLLEPAHAAAHLLNPRRRSLRYYASLHTTTEDAEVVQECDRFLLAQTGGDSTSRDYLVVRDQRCRFHARTGDWGDRLVSDAKVEGCHGDQETHHCAAWQQGGGYVLPWVMDGVDTERRLADEDKDGGDPEPDVWGARPVGTFTDREIRRQIDVFRKDDTSRPREVSAVFGDRAATVLPFDHVPPPPSRGAGEGSAAAAEDGEDDWTDAEDVAGGTDRTAEQVYFTYGGGSDGHAPRKSVITDDVVGGAQGSATRHPPRVEVVASLLATVHDIPDYSTDVREREETVEDRDARLDREEEAWLQSMPRWEGREAYEAEQQWQRELETIGAGPPSSVGRMPTSDTMQPPSGPSHVVGGGADTCGFSAGGGGKADVSCEGGHVRGVETVRADTGAESSDDGEECADAEAIVGDELVDEGSVPLPREELVDEGSVPLPQEELVDEGSVPLPQEELVDEGSVPLPQEELDEGDLALPEEELVDEGSVPLEGSVPFEAFVDGATEDDEEGVAVDAGHSAPSVRDGVTGGHDVEEEGAAIDKSLAIIVRPPSVRDIERGGHIDSGGPGSFSTGGHFGEMPQWDGREPGECTPTPLHPEQLERLGTEDPFPFTGGQPSPPPWAPVSPMWTGSLQSNIRERESLERQAAVFSGGPGSSHAQPQTRPVSRASQQGSAPAAGLPPIGGRGSGRGSSPSHRGGVLGGWSSCRRVTDSLRRDYDRGRGLSEGVAGERFAEMNGGSCGHGLQEEEMEAVVMAVSTVVLKTINEMSSSSRDVAKQLRKRRALLQSVGEAADCVATCEAVVYFCVALSSGIFPWQTPRWWIKRRTGGTWEDLRQCDDATDEYYHQKLRMSMAMFKQIVVALASFVEKKVTHYRTPLPAEQVIAFALYRWASGETYESGNSAFGIGRVTGLQAVRDVTSALLRAYPDAIKWPVGRRRAQILRAFRDKGFLNCFGAINCTHIYIDKPAGAPSTTYYDRNHKFFVQAQVVVDLDLRILDVHVGYPGSVHGVRVLHNSHLWRRAVGRQCSAAVENDSPRSNPMLHQNRA
ncbi:hypothetical protein CBR_g59146 [Chara braunii]|uniref:DUF659 domain-containing protein n=1 Tax=Chara braunii TaxID=69332 RepID=A0A388MEZ0_CHABU|nr:hypothetical protein CBR_g59146 [Chara braunii]|eukprot:GBG93121.1 hypothetical protein CBR_g59146 [Chara braunii]